jgi:TonB family protein
VGERGIAAVLAGEFIPGETVAVEVRLSEARALQTSATVKYQDKLRCGFEFAEISAEQRTAIREWAREAKAETEVGALPPSKMAGVSVRQIPARSDRTSYGGGGFRGGPRKKRSFAVWIAILVLALVALGIFWWRWNRAWDELESGLKTPERALAESPKVKVPTEVMQKLVVHRVDPVYPAEARNENLRGIIALELIVARDGTVVSTRALNGPDVLARAAADALRWWKFEPYRMNGEPVAVETTMAVEFK